MKNHHAVIAWSALAGLLQCGLAQAQGTTSGFYLNNVTVQRGSQEALRSRPSPWRADLVSTTGARLINFALLQYASGAWTWSGAYADNRTLGNGNAYSLTNPMAFGVNTVETSGNDRTAVDYKSGVQELTLSYKNRGTTVIVGKIDTANWYLADPIFAGDLNNGNDYANAATRVVAPPFPSAAMVVRYTPMQDLTLTGIVGDAFGDRETLQAARNLHHGDLSYVLELNYQNTATHYQLTLNHVDAYRFFDKDAEWPVPGEKAPQADAIMATASHRWSPHWAGFARASAARGDGVLEDLNILAGLRHDWNQFYLLASQSATRVATDSTPYARSRKGDVTWVSEITLNYRWRPGVTVGLTYNAYRTGGEALLAKDGGWAGATNNQVLGVRISTFVPF